MTCIKTGAHVYLAEYNEWAYGDMHEYDPEVSDIVHLSYNGITVDSIYVFRVAQTEFTPIFTHKHFTIHKIANWFKDQPYGTIIATSVTDHDYEGIPV